MHLLPVDPSELPTRMRALERARWRERCAAGEKCSFREFCAAREYYRDPLTEAHYAHERLNALAFRWDDLLADGAGWTEIDHDNFLVMRDFNP